MWDDARHDDHRAHASPVRGRRFTDSPREQDAEAAEARKANLHADVRHRVLASREQAHSELDA